MKFCILCSDEDLAPVKVTAGRESILNIPVSDFLDKMSVNYFEIENKFKFKNANIAIGVPFGYYGFMEDNRNTSGFFFIDPRVYFTFGSSSNKIEFNLVPKVHIFFIDEEFGFHPGLCLGFGFSSDLRKWAIRPEFGFDGNASFGISLNMNLSQIFKTN